MVVHTDIHIILGAEWFGAIDLGLNKWLVVKENKQKIIEDNKKQKSQNF